MAESDIHNVLLQFHIDVSDVEINRFCSEEDGSPYNVWKVTVSDQVLVLKKTTAQEREVYECFFPGGGGPVPKIFGFTEYQNDSYMLMEYVEGVTLSRCARDRLKLTLDALIDIQERFWENGEYSDIGYGFEKCYSNRAKRTEYMEDLKPAYLAYLDEFKKIPNTLCNDDMLPFNVLVNEHRAVILDWEYAGILPYPCALARLIAFGEDDPEELFQMSEEDRQFAIEYYYDRLIRKKGICKAEYLRTIKLFLLKEYSEWVYCANSSGDREMPYYQKYYEKAARLARELGYGGQ